MTTPTNPLLCTTCTSPDVIAVRPGSEPEIAPGGIVLRAGQAAEMWCLGCWPWAPVERPQHPEAVRP